MVKLTKEQDAFIKTFNDKSLALHYISSWGWDSWLRNGTGEVYELGAKTPFTLDEKEKMLNAIINGYEVIEPKFKFYNFSDRTDSTPLYYAGKENGLNRNKKFALEVKKDSEEYKALLTLGFIGE
jgi:hypothetical protein